MKKLFVVLFSLIFVASAFATEVGPIVDTMYSSWDLVESGVKLNLNPSATATTVSCATTETVYTNTITLQGTDIGNSTLCIYYQAASSNLNAVANMHITIEQSATPNWVGNGYIGNYVADTTWWVAVDSSASEYQVTDVNGHIASITGIVAMPYLRFKITGYNGNQGDTGIKIKVGRNFIR